MSLLKGTAFNGSNEVLSIVVNGVEAMGAAFNGQVFYTKGSEIYSLVSAGNAVVSTPTTFVISCNRLTEYLVTYSVSSSGNLSGVSRNIISLADTEDGKRQISFTVTYGTAGKRTLRVYGASSSISATSNLSVNYIDIPLTITSS